MPVLENPKHEAFAQAVAEGMSGAAAYRTHVSKGNCSDRTAEVTSSKLLIEGSEASLRVDEIRKVANSIAEERLKFTKLDAMQFLVETIQTPVGAIDQNHRQCQEWTRDEMAVGGKRGRLKKGTEPEGNEDESPPAIMARIKVKMCTKLDALKQLSIMCGWNAPEKVDVNLTGPRGVLAGIMKRK